MKLTNRGGVWYVDFRMPDGRRKRVSTNETDRGAADKAAPSVVARAVQQTGAKAGAVSPSLAGLLERTYLSKWQHNVSADYTRLMINRLTREIGWWLADEITHDRLREYCLGMMKEGAKPATVNRRMSHVGLALREAHHDGLIKVLPKLPRYAERNVKERYLSADEEKAVMAWVDRKALCESYDPDTGQDWRYMQALVPFLIDTGCRLSEALGAQAYGDGTAVHLRHGETKSGKARLIPLTTRAQAALKVMLAGPLHGKVSVDWVGWRWLKVREACALPDVNIHILRHTCASRLVQRGVSLMTVSKWLGHASVTVTERYAHLAPDALASAVSALEGAPIGVRHSQAHEITDKGDDPTDLAHFSDQSVG